MAKISPLFVLLLGIAIGAGSVVGLARTGSVSLPVLSLPAIPAVGQASPSPRVAAVSEDERAAIRDTIERANEAQAKAVATADDTVMRDTATAQHYQELVRINEDLVAAGVTKIDLVTIEWGRIDVTGDTAKAVTYEIWQATYDDGSIDRSRDENDYTLVKQDGRWLVQADDQPGLVTDTSTSTGGQPPVGVAPGEQTSSNWAGYVATGGTFTAVSGSWTVPDPSRTTPGVEATWVGIGGVTGRDLIQAGTQTIVSGTTTHYQAWIETLPQSSQVVPLTVVPGDHVTVSLTSERGGTWRISLRNDTSRREYTTTVSYASSFSSAEWIEEVPSGGRQLLPLSDFGTVTFTDAAAVKDGRTVTTADAGGQAVTMINVLRQPLAQPSALGGDGASFSVTRTAASDRVDPFDRAGGRFGG